MKSGISAFCFAVAMHIAAYGADVIIGPKLDPETGNPMIDPVSGMQIGDVDALTNAIKTASNNQKIYLSKGVYDLSPLTNAPMYAAGGGGYGASLLNVDKAGLRIIGETGDPKDVVIKAVDSEYRLLTLYADNSGIYNLTMTGGNAATAHINTYGYRRGGAVMLINAGTVVSNCVFTGNKAGTSGGAVSGASAFTGTVYDSVFYGNDETPAYGLVASRTTLCNCIFTNNVATKAAQGDWSVSITDDCRVYDSYFSNNMAGRTGGVSGGSAENCKFFFNSQNNMNGNNWGNPGGGAAYGAALTNCIFYGNTANRIGGAIRGGKVVNCTVISNCTRNATDALGGGIYGASLVEGCTVSSNISVCGGGVSHCTATNCTISYNMAAEGGGARTSYLTDCHIEHNVATKYLSSNYGGAGGGIEYGAATNCVFRDNSCSAAYGAESLVNCDIGDTSINAKVMDSCVIHDVQNDKMARAIGNVAYPNGHTVSNIFMINGVQLMRNCLMTNCLWKSIPGSFVNSAVFNPDSPVTTRVENCTFVDNKYYLLSRHYSGQSTQIAIVNSVLVGNSYNTVGDVVTMESAYLVLSNCVYGTLGSCTPKAEGFANFGCTSITDRAAYKFTGDAEHPYSLKLKSPLRGWGLVLDWMEDGVDFAGNPRLRDGKVDVGCYQCWLNPVGTVFSIW